MKGKRTTPPLLQRLAQSLLPLVLLLSAWSCGMPRDPERSLERAHARGSLRVGVDDGGGAAHADERALVEGFARSQGLEVEWRAGALAVLREELERFELDVVVAGLAPDDPWLADVGATRPWRSEPDGARRVLAVAPGENRLLTALDLHVLRQPEERRR